MKIAVGSTNRDKIKAVKNVVGEKEIDILSIAVPSGVRPQPLSEEETKQGAHYRAKECIMKGNVDLAIGLEAGVFFSGEDVYLCHFGVLLDKEKNRYVTNGPILLLPSQIKEDLLSGKDLNSILHQFSIINPYTSKADAISMFTQGRLSKEEVYTQITKTLFGQYEYYLSFVAVVQG